MRISLVVAGMNIILNWLFISIFNDALGAAIATAITFFTNWICSIIVGMRVSGVKISWRKQFLMYVILTMQAAEIILFKNMYVVAIGIVVIVILNWNTIVWARSKWNQLIKFRKV